MLWARDGAGECRSRIRSAESLLTVMMRVMGAGMVEDRIVVRDSQTSSDVIAGIATATSTTLVAEVAIVTSNKIDGVVGDRHS